MRATARYLLKTKQPRLTQNALRDVVAQALNPAENSAMRGLWYLGAMSHRYGLDSAFYFKASPFAPFDSGYNPSDPLLQPALRQLQAWGFEFGYHPGYYTHNNPQNFMAEKNRLTAALGVPLRGGRQHYLRFTVPDTWYLWEAAGFEYDSTLSYAGHEGFRAGTCHPFHPFDIGQNRSLNLLEVPLIVMEGTLHGYRQLSAAESMAQILRLARRCQAVGGTFTLLWHNTAFTEAWLPWAQIYEPTLSALKTLAQTPVGSVS